MVNYQIRFNKLTNGVYLGEFAGLRPAAPTECKSLGERIRSDEL